MVENIIDWNFIKEYEKSLDFVDKVNNSQYKYILKKGIGSCYLANEIRLELLKEHYNTKELSPNVVLNLFKDLYKEHFNYMRKNKKYYDAYKDILKNEQIINNSELENIINNFKNPITRQILEKSKEI